MKGTLPVMLNRIVESERFDSAAINRLPVFRFEGPVSVVRDRAGLTEALRDLDEERLLGFDTETRPAFKKGERHAPALLQLAGAERVYVFQLSVMGLPDQLRALLSDEARIKAGVALAHDVRELRTIADFAPAGFVELEQLARRAGLKNFGLRGLAAALLGVRISKNARLSNWAAPRLSPDQVAYAATDAWISRELYLRFEQGGCAGTEIAAAPGVV
jgi:ribonuclease D